MSSVLVINAAGRETRVALVENGHIQEFYLERKKDKGIVGNIYKGRVVRVLPGMQAAFVDIGLEKAAFLYVSDVVYDPDFARAQFELTEGEHEDVGDVPEPAEVEATEVAHAEEQKEGEGPEKETPVSEVPAPRTAGAEPAVAQGLGAAARAAAEAVAQLVPEEAPASPAAALRPEEAAHLPGSRVPEAVVAGMTEARHDGSAAALAAQAVAELLPLPPEELGAQRLATGVPQEPAAAPDAQASSRPSSAVQVKGERRHQPEGKAGHEARTKEKEKGGKGARAEEKEKAKPGKQTRIEDVLKVGQEVVVQVSKDPIGTKGARLTSHISIPGRHLVFMPTVDHVGISRRISNEKERRRLREIVDRMRPPGTGFIVRTVAEGVPHEKLESDIRFLIQIWNQVVRKNERRSGPGLMHPDLDLILRATRDLFAQDVEKLVVDDREEYERVLGFVTAQDPALASRIHLHENEEPVFDAYGIEQELSRATQRKVWLKSGGYLIIDQAEALTAIDVNSGRYVGKKSLEETITKINVEAAKEIVYQLRLRNIGGIIICDFIDMEKAQNRDKVFKALQEALGRDKAKTNVLRISELGLVEMTRKRVRESIGRVLHEDCAYCDGKGYVKTALTVCYEIFREIRREAASYKDPTLVINCSSDVARLLQGEERQELRHLMDRFNKSIQVRAQQNYHREQYDIYGRSAQGTDYRISSSPGPFNGARKTEGSGEMPHGGARPSGERERSGRGRDRGGRDRAEPQGRSGGRKSDQGAQDKRSGEPQRGSGGRPAEPRQGVPAEGHAKASSKPE